MAERRCRGVAYGPLTVCPTTSDTVAFNIRVLEQEVTKVYVGRHNRTRVPRPFHSRGFTLERVTVSVCTACTDTRLLADMDVSQALYLRKTPAKATCTAHRRRGDVVVP